MAAQIILAGGGNITEQQQQIFIPEVRIEVVQPPPDNTVLWVSGIVVPVLIFALGYWLNNRKGKSQ